MIDLVLVPFREDHFGLASPISRATYYPHLWEPEEAFVAKMELYPAGCWSAFVDGDYAGYIFGHPWRGEHIPLATQIESLPSEPDHYYIHDLLVGEAFRGQGIAKHLFGTAMANAVTLKVPEMRLVSVLNSDGFWGKLGFEKVHPVDYSGNTGWYMRRLLQM